jgi:hypothetical protein
MAYWVTQVQVAPIEVLGSHQLEAYGWVDEEDLFQEDPYLGKRYNLISFQRTHRIRLLAVRKNDEWYLARIGFLTYKSLTEPAPEQLVEQITDMMLGLTSLDFEKNLYDNESEEDDRSHREENKNA